MSTSGNVVLPSAITEDEFAEILSIVAQVSEEEPEEMEEKIYLFLQINDIHLGTKRSVMERERDIGPVIVLEKEAAGVKEFEYSALISDTIIGVRVCRSYQQPRTERVFLREKLAMVH